MNNLRSLSYSEWSVLSHNIRGLNSSTKWNAIRCAIQEFGCDVVCLQETKREFFDGAYLKNFCPNCLDNFAYVPSIGNSGGSIVIWKSSKLAGSIIFRMNMRGQWNFSPSCQTITVLSQTYMPCAPRKENWTS
jgi:exonuclease III